MVEIVSGVTADDLIVTAGQLKLRDGMPVRVAAAEGAPDNAATSRLDQPASARAEPVSTPAKAGTASAPSPKS